MNAWRLWRARPGSGRQGHERPARLAADLPLALDLIAACLTAGAPVVSALDVVADAVGGPLGDELSIVARGLRLGAGPREACRRLLDPASHAGRSSLWARLTARETGTSSHEMAAFARALHRSEGSGTRLAATLERLADQCRAEHRDRALAAARRAGIAAVAPLGLCFLPAFITLGVIPVIIAVGSHLELG